MENASKALLIATSVLVGVLLVSVMVYIFYFTSKYSSQIGQNLQSKENYEYNIKFQVYDQRDNLTPQEVKSIINLTNDANSKNEEQIKIIGINTSNFSIQENENTYTCKITQYKNGKITRN